MMYANRKSKNEKFTKCLLDMKKILDKNDQEFFLACGTLLGCVRNNDFIVHDEDIDISIFYDKFDKNIKDKILESKRFTFVSSYGKIKDSFEISFRHKYGVKIDIFISYKIKDNSYYYASFNGICDLKKEGYCKWITPIKDLCSITFKNKNFLIPSNSEEYLEGSYGKDWRVPRQFDYFEGLSGGYTNLIN